MSEASRPEDGPSGWVYLGGPSHWLLASDSSPDEVESRLNSAALADEPAVVDIVVLLRPGGDRLVLHVVASKLQYFAVGRDLISAPGKQASHEREPGSAPGIRGSGLSGSKRAPEIEVGAEGSDEAGSSEP